MTRLKNILIPGVCLAVAAALLFGRDYIFRTPPAPPVYRTVLPAAADDVITLHYHERAPYYVEAEGKVTGLCADPAALAFETAGIPFRWRKTPAKRQLDVLKENRGRDCILGWFKNLEREAFAKFTLPIYQDQPAIAIARADNSAIASGRLLENIFSNPKLILLRKDGYSYGRFVDEKIAQLNPAQVVTAAENIGMLKMIHTGRADYFLIGEEEADGLFGLSGIPEADFKYIRFANMPPGNAHDFNNILSAIFGYTELAISSVDDKKALLEDLQEVLKAGHRAKDLVKQILAFSRQSNQELRPVQMQLIAKEALKLIRPSLPATIEIQTNIQSDGLIMADSTQIHQVLMNLCTNAGHAMQEEGGILEITLTDIRLDSDFTSRHPDIKPGAFLKLTVRDTGHGIAPDLLDKIFVPFFTTKDKGQGTGMGLSVVHGIIKSLGGTVTVYSELEKGAEFNVYLPVIERGLKEEQRIELPLPTGTERILFVDDEQAIREISKKLLESLGYHVEVRSNAIEAFELFKVNPERFDLVITDMTMPNMTGDRLAEQVMAVRPDIPVIVCTGFSTRIDKEKASAMGIRAFALKPVIKSDIAEIIRKVLDRKKI